ncbi:recQ-mediated genome instability protein 2 isoform X9 [Colius striatus]|uniref:recQ-mediated genome instability protein 2 isoform X9 n=1 Tax=Colius striatus TaxID=57412 RepID=UPI002B1DC040|nr:recQ-mediated genome instability protein 2 isoform X9 [Colius striatus]
MRGNGKKSDQASNVGSFNMTRAALLKATGSVWTEQQEHSPLVRNRAGGNPFRKHWERECQERPARRHQGKTHVSEDGLEDLSQTSANFTRELNKLFSEQMSFTISNSIRISRKQENKMQVL